MTVPTTLLEVQQRLSSVVPLSWADWMALGHSPIWQDLNPQSSLDATTLERLDVPALMSELTAALKGQGLNPNQSARKYLWSTSGPLLRSQWFTRLEEPVLPRVVTIQPAEGWTPLRRAAQEVIIGLLIGQGVDKTDVWDYLGGWSEPESRTVPHQYWTLARWVGFKNRPSRVSWVRGLSLPQPWIYAVVSSHTLHMSATVQALLNQGDTCHKFSSGYTALHALINRADHLEEDRLEKLKTIDLLVAHDQTLLDTPSRTLDFTPLCYAITHDDLTVAQRLIELGADRHLTCHRNARDSDERLSLWLLACDNVTTFNLDSRPALALEWLLTLGFDRHEVTDQGNNALHLAVNLYAKYEEFYTIDVDRVIWLLDHGVNPHHRNHAGQTPLDQLQEHIERADVLLHGVDDTVAAVRSCLERLTLQQSGPDRSALDAPTSSVPVRLRL